MARKKSKSEKGRFKKLYYSITEVGEITGLKPHILRYWESEFPFLRPKRNRAGNRAYRQKDIEMIQQIKRLLYDEGYTIEGAKQRIRQMRKRARIAGKKGVKPIPKECRNFARDIYKRLAEIRRLLE
ncbi:MerR family transcriptional regulator [bacterium]|nr:MAG: MerR family transcriptional regulator [bacterium]